jgi:hypothetical protein
MMPRCLEYSGLPSFLEFGAGTIMGRGVNEECCGFASVYVNVESTDFSIFPRECVNGPQLFRIIKGKGCEVVTRIGKQSCRCFFSIKALLRAC